MDYGQQTDGPNNLLEKWELSREHVVNIYATKNFNCKDRKKTCVTDRRTDGFACIYQIVIDETDAATWGTRMEDNYFIIFWKEEGKRRKLGRCFVVLICILLSLLLNKYYFSFYNY